MVKYLYIAGDHQTKINPHKTGGAGEEVGNRKKFDNVTSYDLSLSLLPDEWCAPHWLAKKRNWRESGGGPDKGIRLQRINATTVPVA